MPGDERAFKENYIQHWGNVFVAGKRLAAGSEDLAIDVVVPGTYTVEDAAVVIDSVTYAIGSTIELARGPHTVSGERTRDATLRWGDHLARPAYRWPAEPLFTQY
jgi:hypothetical protein